MAMVVDHQVAAALAPQFKYIPLPEHGLSRCQLARRGAQRHLVLRDDGKNQGGQLAHLLPSKFEPMKPPWVGGAAMMTWTLSESLSAMVFWINNGFLLISSPSRSICSLVTLLMCSSR